MVDLLVFFFQITWVEVNLYKNTYLTCETIK